MNAGKQTFEEKGRKDEFDREKIRESNESSMISSGSLPSAKVENVMSKPTSDSMSYNPTGELLLSCLYHWGYVP